ncbi:MAG TPA: hypothetical protein VFB12_22500 [Ktedonobacteraceae bacterium]|nr:hypothetical protein [Ktedonobacteraceae bacterium]
MATKTAYPLYLFPEMTIVEGMLVRGINQERIVWSLLASKSTQG